MAKFDNIVGSYYGQYDFYLAAADTSFPSEFWFTVKPTAAKGVYNWTECFAGATLSDSGTLVIKYAEKRKLNFMIGDLETGAFDQSLTTATIGEAYHLDGVFDAKDEVIHMGFVGLYDGNGFYVQAEKDDHLVLDPDTACPI